MDLIPTDISKPLNFQQRQIRLVRIGPSKTIQSPLVCRFTVVSLSSRPIFEALSWCWRDPTDTEEIVIEGCKYRTPKSLVEALRHLRYPDKDRTIWVDALSINQGTDQTALREKSQQIQLMKYIYSLATTTIIWMGVPPEDLATFILSSLADGQQLKEALRNNAEDTMGHMINILLLSWWRRVWVVQEAVLAKNAMVQFGVLDVPFSHILSEFRGFEEHLPSSMLGTEAHQILCLLMQETIGVFSHLLGSFSGLPALHRQALALAQMGRYSSKIVSNRAKPFYDLMEVLVQCRYFQTTDERDKVWGFLGLTTDAVPQKLDPGYELSVAEIYTQTTRKLIHSSGSVYILSQCLPERSSLAGLPSWVPDWTLSRNEGDPHEWNHGPSREDREYIHNASFGQAAKNPEAGWTPEPSKLVKESDMDKVLPVQGLRYIWVEKVYHELGPCNDIYDWWTKTKAWRDAYNSSRDAKKPTAGGGGVLSKFRSQKSKKATYKEELEEYRICLEVYWDLMLQGAMPRSFDPGAYASDPGGDGNGNGSSDDEESKKGKASNRYGSIKHRFGHMVDGQVVCVSGEILRKCRRWGQAMDDGVEYEGSLDLDALFAHLQRTTVGRRFFLGPQWHMFFPQAGLGPATLLRLDEIYVLAGGSHPFALRAHDRKPINPNTSITGDKAKFADMRYKLVGELYLNGILNNGPMDGSVVEAASGDSDESHWMPQRRSNTLWWPPDIHLSKKKINLNDYWWTVWLY